MRERLLLARGYNCQYVIFPFERHFLGNLIGQWLQHTVSNIKHIRRWGGAIASWCVGNQHPYSYTYKTTRTEAWRLLASVIGCGSE